MLSFDNVDIGRGTLAEDKEKPKVTKWPEVPNPLRPGTFAPPQPKPNKNVTNGTDKPQQQPQTQQLRNPPQQQVPVARRPSSSEEEEEEEEEDDQGSESSL